MRETMDTSRCSQNKPLPAGKSEAAPMIEPALLTAKQVSNLLQIHPRTCWRMSATGDIPKPITIAKKVVRWRLSDLQRFLEAKK